MTTDAITNDMDIIDSRDIIKRCAELGSEVPLDDYDQEELDNLRLLTQECSDQPDWTYGVALIRESYFAEYAMQMAEDIGAVDRGSQWPLGHIDWDAAVKELLAGYFEVDFDGVAYHVRS